MVNESFEKRKLKGNGLLKQENTITIERWRTGIDITKRGEKTYCPSFDIFSKGGRPIII